MVKNNKTASRRPPSTPPPDVQDASDDEVARLEAELASARQRKAKGTASSSRTRPTTHHRSAAPSKPSQELIEKTKGKGLSAYLYDTVTLEKSEYNFLRRCARDCCTIVPPGQTWQGLSSEKRAILVKKIISALPSRWRGKIQNRFLNDWVIERVVISCLSQRKRAVKDNMSEASNASDSEPASDKESTNITSKHKGKSKAIILSEGSDLESDIPHDEEPPAPISQPSSPHSTIIAQTSLSEESGPSTSSSSASSAPSPTLQPSTSNIASSSHAQNTSSTSGNIKKPLRISNFQKSLPDSSTIPTATAQPVTTASTAAPLASSSRRTVVQAAGKEPSGSKKRKLASADADEPATLLEDPSSSRKKPKNDPKASKTKPNPPKKPLTSPIRKNPPRLRAKKTT